MCVIGIKEVLRAFDNFIALCCLVFNVQCILASNYDSKVLNRNFYSCPIFHCIDHYPPLRAVTTALDVSHLN